MIDMMKPVYPADWAVPNYSTRELKAKKSRYCVCIPVINEGEKIRSQLKKMRSIAEVIDIIVCDGGSTDGSLDTDFLEKQAVRVLLVKTDIGKLSAQLRMGYAYALMEGYEGIITIDGNGKDGFEAITDFVAALDDHYDLVQGSRFIKGGKSENTPLVRLLAIRLVHSPVISLIAHHWFTDTTNGFRAYSRKYLLDRQVKPFRKIFLTYELLGYLSVRASQIGMQVKELPVSRSYPKHGMVPTKIHPIKGNFDLLKILWSLAIHKFNP